jgi:CRISPR-associated RAMP protein (TIGR02581 family)
MFDTFQSRLTIEGYLVADSALRIGTGRAADVTGTELPVIRDAFNRPFIPGSSLKGAWRSHLEALVRGMAPPGADLRRFACDPTGNEAGLCLDNKGMRALREEYKDNDTSLAQAVADTSCLVCQTFGSPWLASPVRVRDLPVVEREWFGQFQVRDGVTIDRDKGTAADKGLYDYEVVPAGTRFELYIVAENLVPWQLWLLWLALRALERSDIALGGFTSRGLGWVRLEKENRRARLIEGARGLMDLLGGAEVGEEIDDEKAGLWREIFLAELRRRGARDA